MKKLNFLLIPKSNNFRDIIIINDIANELKKKGHNCLNLTCQINDENLIFLLSQTKIDVVFRVNKGKPENIKKNIRFICWVTDVSDLKNLSNYNEKDIIYTLKKCDEINKKIKVFQMLPAMNTFKKIETLSYYKLQNKIQSYQNIDFSFVSNFTAIDLFTGNRKLVVHKNEINFKKHKAIEKLITNLNKKFITQSYGLIDYSKNLEKNNIVFQGNISNFNFFFEIFRISKFNILFEDEYLDFNTNFFNILLVEGTLLLKSKLFEKIREYLELEEDSSNYFLKYSDSESFKFHISNYHNNLNKRLKLGKKATNLIRKKHSYKNRVEKILKDILH